MTLARTADYWFSPSAFFVQLNAAGDRNFIHANCSAGSAVMCYMKGVDGLGYDNGHNYKRWTLIASPTAFNDNKAKYVYIAIPKSDAADAVAQFVWPSEKLDIYGYNEAGELIGSEDYYYIWTQGIISASEVNGVRVDREWTQMYETGTLSTDEAFDAERDGLWWRWDPITDTVEFLKTISKAVFEELKADFATIGQLFVEKDARVGGDLNVDGIIWALQGRINDLRSQNFSGSGLGDTGWWLTNDKDGHSYLEVDELLVRMKATFLELEIRKETFTGGNVHYSPAGSVIYRVDYMTADNLLLGYTEVRVPWLLKRMPFLLDKFAYSARRRIRREMTDEEWLRCAKFRCYMMADDGTTATRNWWQVGDQARCQSFNKTKVTAKRNGTYSTTYVNAEDPSEPWSTDFYWRMVIEVGSEILEDGHAYDYVDFAFADQKDAAGNYVNSEADRRAQCIAGSGIPAAGDTIVCMGNRFNPERMNMVSILSVGADAPAIKGYKGINTFSFEGCEVFCISPKKVEIRSNSFKWILDDGKVLPPKMFRGVYVPGTRYHYYDEVSWIGSIWLCIITDEYFWENRQGTRFSANEVRNVQEGEGNFDYTVANLPGMEGDEIYHGEDHYYKQGTVGNQEVFYVRNYTYSEPADTNPSWLKEVSKGTEITQVIEKYSASKDGINHPPEDAQYWHDTIEQTGIVPGQYLWTRTVTYYSDDRTPTEHYSVSRWGIDGDGIADINSYYWSTDILIQDMAAYERENTVNWVDTYAELGDLGLKQGNYVWEKTQIIYDLADDIDGNPRTLPDLVSYRCNRIGADALIGQEEYYCLRTTNNIDTAFQGIDGWGIPWYRGSYANSEGGRINPSGKINDIWKPKMPTYSSGEAKYLWNFEWHVSGDGTQWATTPRCIGNHAKGIKGVIELYALSASKSPISAQVPIPTDINSKNTFGQIPTSNFGDPQVWGDERYDRAPNDTYPYQWNWERTLYSDGTHEDHYHVSAVKGTKGEDGAGTEFIYKLTDTETAPAKPTNPSDRTADDVVPSGWTDNPSGISFEHQFEWVSQRTKQTGANWGDFSAPRLWAKWGLNGQDGDGVEYVYIRTTSETAPTITDSSSDYDGKQYTDDDYLPNSSAGRCTDDPKGVNLNYPYEWVASRTKGAADSKTGKRSWNKYSGTMSLWAKYGKDGKDGKDGQQGIQGEPGVGFKKINTYTRQYSLAQWHSYGDGGHTESWSISGYDNSHIRVGDSVYLMGKVLDAKDRAGNMVDVACYGVCSSINSSTIYMATTFIVVGGTAGERGPSMRGPQQWDDLPSNYQFYSGGAGEPYVDVVIRNGNYYMCTTTHRKSSSWQSSYWSGTQQVDIVATKLLLANYAYLKNLGAGAIVMYDNSGYTSEDHIVFMAKDGVISCKVGTFENVTVSGTLKGVTGTFNWLDCVDSNGNKVGRICASTGAYGGVAFESVDVVHQGTKDGRSLRFLASDVWVRGRFGAYQRNTAVVKGSTITYYSKGTSNSGVQKSLTSYTSSSGATYYKVPCYPENAGDASGFAVDLLIFSINSSTTYRYVLEMPDTHRMMVVNANDTYNNVRVYANGREVSFDGGALAEVVQVPPAFMISSPASNVLGRGLMISGTRDNDWT